MNKLIAIPAAFVAFTTLCVATAEAGCGGGGFRSFHKPTYQSASRRVAPKVKVARKQVAKPIEVAKAELETETVAEAKTDTTTAAAVTENSSIAADGGKVAEGKGTEQKVATAAKEVGCKQFFPAVGLTLSVSCN